MRHLVGVHGRASTGGAVELASVSRGFCSRPVQVTLPKVIRDALGVGPGDRVLFVRQDDGTVGREEGRVQT